MWVLRVDCHPQLVIWSTGTGETVYPEESSIIGNISFCGSESALEHVRQRHRIITVGKTSQTVSQTTKAPYSVPKRKVDMSDWAVRLSSRIEWGNGSPFRMGASSDMGDHLEHGTVLRSSWKLYHCKALAEGSSLVLIFLLYLYYGGSWGLFLWTFLFRITRCEVGIIKPEL